MASFHDLMIIARTQNFQDRVDYALKNAALAVMAEVNTVTGHALRVTYAGKVLSGTADIFDVAVGVLNNSTIAAEANITIQPDFSIPDADIQFAVNSDFSSYAGVAN